MTAADIQGAYKADETPIKTKTGIENMGIAVFNGDRLVRRIIWHGIIMPFNFNR